MRVLILLLLLSSCTVDYRTDYERNNDLILTEEQIIARKNTQDAIDEFNSEYLKKDMDERRLQQLFTDCYYKPELRLCY
jgi:hypothetical protein